MNEVKWGPGDEETWPAFAGHPNDPRNDYDGDEEEEELLEWEPDGSDWEDRYGSPW